MKKNMILLIEFLFALLSIWVLTATHQRPESALITLRIYVLVMIGVTGTLVLMFRHYLTHHSTIDITRICETVRNLDVPAFIWTNDLNTIYTNEAMDDILGITESEDPGDSAKLLSTLFHSMGISPTSAAQELNGIIYRSTLLDFDRNKRYISWNTSLLKENHNASLYFTIGFETTELVMAKHSLTAYAKNLAASQSRYALSMRLAGIGILLCESVHDVFYVSDEAKEFLGIDHNEITFQEFRQRLHPEDRFLFDEYLEKMRSVKKDTTRNKPQTLEFRIRPAVGKPYVWYSYHYQENLTNATGGPIIGGALIDITGEKNKDATIERLAFMDDITEIANRNKLIQDGEQTYQLCKKTGSTYWIIVLDIDRFHIINDSLGYEKGDKYLRDFAHLLCKHTASGGMVARLSADNFAMLVQDYGDEELPMRIVEQIRIDMAELSTGDSSTTALSCSAAFARIPNDGNSFKEAMEHAEFTLAIGRGQLSYLMGYNAAMHREEASRSELEKELAHAIASKQLQLYYQPKVDLRTGRTMGAEALIRWVKPDGTMVSPNIFIPIAERTGLISEISHFVLHEACAQNALWQKIQFNPIVISINFTSEDFFQKDVCEMIQDVLIRTGLKPKWLELELTERLALGDVNYTIQQMNMLRELGVLLAMDDFGTGYSSLSYIQLLPLTLLKLDRSFISKIETDMVAREIVSAIIKIAKSMGIETIAEGVESEGQVAILKAFGCDYVQGYLYGKPMTALQFQKRLEEESNH
ncbi:MAG: EAL domain-containing protein [Oscillospiraceae bacterium]|nr:EAL domain-containing protein [Oscillospiraceae bacterium]